MGITLVLLYYILDGDDFSSLEIEILIMAVESKFEKCIWLCEIY